MSAAHKPINPQDLTDEQLEFIIRTGRVPDNLQSKSKEKENIRMEQVNKSQESAVTVPQNFGANWQVPQANLDEKEIADTSSQALGALVNSLERENRFLREAGQQIENTLHEERITNEKQVRELEEGLNRLEQDSEKETLEDHREAIAALASELQISKQQLEICEREKMMHLEANVKEKAVSNIEKEQLQDQIDEMKGTLNQRNADNELMNEKVEALSQALQNYSKSAEVELKILQDKLHTTKNQLSEVESEKGKLEKKLKDKDLELTAIKEERKLNKASDEKKLVKSSSLLSKGKKVTRMKKSTNPLKSAIAENGKSRSRRISLKSKTESGLS